MKKLLHALPALLLALLMSHTAQAQYGHSRYGYSRNSDLAFHKGAITASLTWGATYADYRAQESARRTISRNRVNGARDPLFIEYGLSSDLGLGLSLGTDLFNIDPSRYYGVTTSLSEVTVFMSDASIYSSYHFFTTERVDIAISAGIGLSAVTINGREGDTRYEYNSAGYIVRSSGKFTYFFSRKWGVTAILSAFTNHNSPRNFEGNTFGKDYMTAISGLSWEAGLTHKFR